MGLIEELKNCVLYWLKQDRLKCVFLAVRNCFKGQIWVDFCIDLCLRPKCRSITAATSKKAGNTSFAFNVMVRRNTDVTQIKFCALSGQLSVVYYALFKPTGSITRDSFRAQLGCLSQTLIDASDAMLQEAQKSFLYLYKAQPYATNVVRTCLEMLKCDSLPICHGLHPLFLCTITCSELWPMT